jgi:hypothetical protein
MKVQTDADFAVADFAVADYLCIKNLSISNFLFLNCFSLFFNKYLFSSSICFSKKHNFGVVPIAGWCVGRISFYVSLLSSCAACDG